MFLKDVPIDSIYINDNFKDPDGNVIRWRTMQTKTSGVVNPYTVLQCSNGHWGKSFNYWDWQTSDLRKYLNSRNQTGFLKYWSDESFNKLITETSMLVRDGFHIYVDDKVYIYGINGDVQNIVYDNFYAYPRINLDPFTKVTYSNGVYYDASNVTKPTINVNFDEIGEIPGPYEYKFRVSFDDATTSTLNCVARIGENYIFWNKDNVIKNSTYELEFVPNRVPTGESKILNIECTNGLGGKTIVSYPFTINNNILWIDGTNKDFGSVNGNIFTNSLIQTVYYSGGSYSVKAELDGSLYKTSNFTGNGTFDYSIDNNLWGGLNIGQHIIKITAYKDGLQTIREFKFTKSQKQISITTSINTEIGKISKPFNIPYTIIAGDMGHSVEQIIYINESRHKLFTFMGKKEDIFEINKGLFDSYFNYGENTIRISVRNLSTGDTDEITFTFIKVYDSIDIQSMPKVTSGRATKVWVRVQDDLPKITNYTVKVCNNAMDRTPFWEDMTSEFLNGKPYELKNTIKEKNEWAIMVRIILEKDIAQPKATIYGFGYAYNIEK